MLWFLLLRLLLLRLLLLWRSGGLHLLLTRCLRNTGRRRRANYDLKRDDLLADARERRRFA